MHLIESFVRNPVKVAVGVLIAVLFGLIALFRMPMQLTPEVQIPTITIETRWPGASPFEVEREIIQEQEEQLAGVEGVVKMSSESADSLGKIELQFDPGADMQEALVKVNARLQQVPEYPEDADEPTISTSSSSDRAIAWFILSARMPTIEEIVAWQAEYPQLAELIEPVRTAHNEGLGMLRLRRLLHAELDKFLQEHPEEAENLRPVKFLDVGEIDLEVYLQQYPDLATSAALSRLMPADIDVPKLKKFAEDFIETEFERVKGVSNSNVVGGEEIELQVVVDPLELAARHLTIADVRRVLRVENQDTSAGDFSEGKRRWVVRTRGQFREIQQVEEQILGVNEGAPVFIRDVADVRIGYKKPDTMVRRFGTGSIAVNAQRSTGANVLEVMQGLREKNQQLNDGILKDNNLQLNQVYDETEYINSAISLVQWNIIIGATLTTVVLLTFLRSPRSTLVIFLAIPTSIIGTFLLLNLMGRSLNVISLAGLSFAVGMLVDNAVVVLENIFRHYQQGDPPIRAAVRGTTEVWGAVVASTLTTLAVFLPVLFVSQEAGQLFRDIALAISCAVGLSLIVSVTVIPVGASRLFKKQNDRAESTHPLARPAGLFVWLVVESNAWIQRGIWRRVAVVVLLMGGTVALMFAFWPKVEYLPPGNRNLAIGLIFPPPGYNLDKLMDIGQWVEDELQPYWDIDPESEEARKLDYPIIADWFYVARGRQVFLGIRAYDKTRAGKLAELIRNKLNGRLPGAIVVANQSSLFEQGLAAGRAIDVEITGPDLETLVGLGGRMMGQIGSVAGQRERKMISFDDELQTDNHPSGAIREIRSPKRGVLLTTQTDDIGRVIDVRSSREGGVMMTIRAGAVSIALDESNRQFTVSDPSGRKTVKYEGQAVVQKDDRGNVLGIKTADGNALAAAIRDSQGEILEYRDGRGSVLGTALRGEISVDINEGQQQIVLTKLIEAAQARPIPSLDLNSPEVHVTPLRMQAADLQVDATDLGYTVNALVDGAYAADYYMGGTKIDLTIKGKDQYAQQTHDIDSLPIATPIGQVVPLVSLADVKLDSGPEQVNRRERQRAITVQVTPPLAVPLEDAIERINAEVVAPMRADGSLRGGYTVNLSGTADKLAATWNALSYNVLLAVVITYLLMAALFESWLYPFVIILSVPLAAVGGILGLNLLSGYIQWQGFAPQTLDVLTMLGFVILIGTAVNNAILIVHQSLNHMHEDAMPPREAILESVRTRIRPIFMTTFTTVFGLLPLVLLPGAGSELYRGLGSVVLGGLIVSTFFTLILVPTLFSLMMDIREWVLGLLFGSEAEVAEEPRYVEEEPLPAPVSK